MIYLFIINKIKFGHNISACKLFQGETIAHELSVNI